jgi:8-amino-7-oxononanoate synthase
MPSLDLFARNALDAIDARQQRRVLVESVRDGVQIRRDGVDYISFACNDYLGLAQRPEVLDAARAVLEKAGGGAGASRLVSGNHDHYAPLEQALAAHKGQEAGLVFGSGYLTNLGIIPALVGKGDLVLLDKLAHACMLDGAVLSGATMKRFRHNDALHLRALLEEDREHYRNVLIVTEHIFSMDGDRAPLQKMSDIAREYDAWLMADDAHGLGFFEQHASLGVDIWMGTMSKALGSYGGYVTGSKALIDYLVSAARSLVFTTGLPPATCAGALMALRIMQREPELAKRAHAHAMRVAKALKLPEPAAAILPVMLGTEEAALAASTALREYGLYVQAIRPPTVPPGTSRLRLAFSADHTDAQVDLLIGTLQDVRLKP